MGRLKETLRSPATRILLASSLLLGGIAIGYTERQRVEQVSPDEEIDKKIKEILEKIKRAMLPIFFRNIFDEEDLECGAGIAISKTELVTINHLRTKEDGEILNKLEVFGLEANHSGLVLDEGHDLAIFRVEGLEPFDPVPLADKPARTGDSVWFAHFDWRTIKENVLGFIFSQGTVDCINEDGTLTLIVDPPASKGSSGGGVFNKNGELVGIVHGGIMFTLSGSGSEAHAQPAQEILSLWQSVEWSNQDFAPNVR